MKFTVTFRNGSYAIRFTLRGKRREFYPGTKDELVALQIARKMYLEWELGQFDETLKRYSLKAPPKCPEPSLLQLWDEWVESLQLSKFTANNHYHCIRRVIETHNPKWDEVEWLLTYKFQWAPRTFNQRKSYLKSCLDWAISKGFIQRNPYVGIRAARGGRNNHVKPFSKDEIAQILHAFESNQFCPKRSAFLHSYYVPFIKFQFLTGARPGETIALQWKHVDFEESRVLVEQALGRCLDSSPFATRKVLKETKTGTSGFIPMPPELRELLESIKPPEAPPETWVFPGQRGNYMDTRTFREIWQKVLKGLGIEYRYPYQTRHTVLSHVATKQGLLAASHLARHRNSETVTRHYSRFVGEVELPKLF